MTNKEFDELVKAIENGEDRPASCFTYENGVVKEYTIGEYVFYTGIKNPTANVMLLDDGIHVRNLRNYGLYRFHFTKEDVISDAIERLEGEFKRNMMEYKCSLNNHAKPTAVVFSSKDIGKKVEYVAFEGAHPEEGVITSVNDSFVFVDYRNEGRGIATPALKLKFI